MASYYRGERCNQVAFLFLALSWTAVSLRVYVRAFMIKSFGVDDWLSVLSLILFSFYCAFVIVGVHYGTGRHLPDIEPENFIIAMKAWWIAELGYVSSTMTLKLSIGFFLLRLCVKKIQRAIIWFVLGVVTAYSLFYFFLVIFQCRPTNYFWNQYNPIHAGHGKCISTAVIGGTTYAHSALSVVADWTLGILPIFLVWNLNMNPRTKVLVAVILALGALGSTATIVRIPYIYQLTRTKDFLFANVDISIWSTVEPGIGITASAMATLRPLLVTFLSRSRLFGSSTREPSGTWAPRSANQKGYFRSGGGNDNPPEALDLPRLRTDRGKESSVSTTIHSVNDMRSSGDHEQGNPPPLLRSALQNASVDETIKRIQRFGGLRGGASGSPSTKGLKGPGGTWNSSESRLAEDSSSEEGMEGGEGVAVFQGSWRPMEVLRTTQVVSSSEPKAGNLMETEVGANKS